LVAEHSEQFGIAQARFSAHGRIDVYSEGTTDTRRGADFSQFGLRLKAALGELGYVWPARCLDQSESNVSKRGLIFSAT
jgi:hypothetical protein